MVRRSSPTAAFSTSSTEALVADAEERIESISFAPVGVVAEMVGPGCSVHPGGRSSKIDLVSIVPANALCRKMQRAAARTESRTRVRI